jgi:hypothetical protein
MKEYHQRARDYLNRKKPARPETLTTDVNFQSEPAFTPTEDSSKLIGYIIMAVVVVFMLWQAYQVGEVQNRCYLSKECREWAEKNR